MDLHWDLQLTLLLAWGSGAAGTAMGSIVTPQISIKLTPTCDGLQFEGQVQSLIWVFAKLTTNWSCKAQVFSYGAVYQNEVSI